MSWTITKSGGFTKYFQDLDSNESDTITLAGSGALVITAADVEISTAGKDGVYTELFETSANQEVTIPAGAHLLKCEDDVGGGDVTVYVTDSGIGQDTLTFDGIGKDPS